MQTLAPVLLALSLAACAIDPSGAITEPLTADSAPDAIDSAPDAIDSGPDAIDSGPDAPDTAAPGVTCVTTLGSFTGCDGQSHAYVVSYSAESEGPQAPADNGLMPWRCWALQIVDPAEHVCPSGNTCEVWDPTDAGIVHSVGTCQ